MSDDTLTHRELANLLGVSETTIKSYRRKFPGFIPVASKGKPIRFKSEAQELAMRIRDLFSTGMSVEEVRGRLVSEFAWLKDKTAVAPRSAKEAAGGRESAQSFAAALSSMAKSMVAFNQQQTIMSSSMQRIEAMLKELGLIGFDSQVADGLMKQAEQRALAQRQEFADTAQKLMRLVESAQAALEENKKLNQSLATERTLLAGAMAAMPTSAKAESVLSKVVPLHEEVRPEPTQVYVPSSPLVEPPRHLMSLPLVVRTPEGAYMSAGGRTLVRLSLNDIKAMLVQVHIPPDNYTIRWEDAPEGWWVLLEQSAIPIPGEAKNLRLLVAEIASTKGISVLEVREYVKNKESVHPAEFAVFVADLISNVHI